MNQHVTMTLVDLDQRANLSLQKLLWNGLNLARAFGSYDRVHSGRVRAWIPDGVDAARGYDFAAGWGLQTASESEARVVEEVMKALARPGRALVAEGVVVRPSDLAAAEWPVDVFTCGVDVYGIAAGNSGRAEVQTLFSYFRDEGAAMFVVDAGGESLKGEVSIGVLCDLAEHVELLLVSAYDGESFVVWEPGTSG